MARPKNKDSFSIKLLKTLAIGGLVVLASSSPHFGLQAGGAFKKELDKKKWREFYGHLNSLRKKKRIHVSQNQDGSYNVAITTFGKDLVTRYSLDDLTIKKPSEWDGGWRFCAFDIPKDANKLARHSLVSKLKELGFIMVQKSLWAHPFECREELSVVARAFEVEPYVCSFIAYEMDIDKERKLKSKFYAQTGIFLK
ncbi:MAG: hypothetical protein AAB799_02450 [Patescibacteria group bacterium]